VLRLTWRNLLARKVRLLMSTLAIVLGIGFLAGVMTFSTGLNATFENIVSGSTSDAMVRPAGEVSAASAGVATTQLITPADVDKLSALPEVAAATGSVDGFGSYLLGQDGKLVGGQGAPTLAFNYAPAENMAGEQILVLNQGGWPETSGEVTLDTSSAERGGYEIGDAVTLTCRRRARTPVVRSPSSAPRTSTAAALPAAPSSCSTPSRRRTSS
jgi:putative ABC transport system permease protein